MVTCVCEMLNMREKRWLSYQCYTSPALLCCCVRERFEIGNVKVGTLGARGSIVVSVPAFINVCAVVHQLSLSVIYCYLELCDTVSTHAQTTIFFTRFVWSEYIGDNQFFVYYCY